MNLKTINQRISQVRRMGVNFNNYVHETAVGIIAHAMEHGDCTPALRLVQAMPKSSRRALLITWFGRYSPIGMNVNQGTVAFHKEGAKLYRPFDLDGARANPFHDMPEAKDEDLPDTTCEDVQKGILGLVKKLQKRVDDNEVAANDKPTVVSTIASLKELAGRAVVRVQAAA